MKKMILLLLVTISLSCSNQETEDQQPPDAIQGAWNLYSYMPGWGNTESYSGQITWIFDGYGHLNVEIYGVLPEESLMPIKENGTFTYSMENGGVYINELNFSYGYTIDSLNMGLELFGNVAADGPLIKFSKIEF